jgi:hypothetical protein
MTIDVMQSITLVILAIAIALHILGHLIND